jgi:hypothetical protein
MNRRFFLIGLLLVPIGVVLLLYFSITAHPYSTTLKWLGVGVMIGGPFVCWEVLPDLVEPPGDEGSH